MESRTLRFPAASRSAPSPRGRLSRRVAVVLAVIALPAVAPAAGPPPVTIKGRIAGSGKLLNPVWNEAKDPALNRYTFREQSATVRSDVRTLTGYLPKELCIAALTDGEAAPIAAPLRVVVAGGRTTPVTLVVAKGQQLHFENQDPFSHKLYVVGADSKGFGAVETGPGKTRGWTAPGPGKYEIRDLGSPSLRSWIVVEARTAGVGYPDRKGDFQMELQKGTYKLRGYFNGESVGTDLDIYVAPTPLEQPLKFPLLVGDPPETPAKAGASKQPAASGKG